MNTILFTWNPSKWPWDDLPQAVAEANVDDMFDASGVYQPVKATAHIDGELIDLPIDLIDALMQEGGRLTTLLGPILNGKVLADVTTAGGNASIEANSEQLHINAKIVFDDDGIRQDPWD